MKEMNRSKKIIIELAQILWKFHEISHLLAKLVLIVMGHQGQDFSRVKRILQVLGWQTLTLQRIY